MKIIDWEAKGNVIRFYLGEDSLQEWEGEDWNDKPYEHNAGMVYDCYISGLIDIVVPFEDEVIESCIGKTNSPYSKKDMVDRKIPCLVVLPYDTIRVWIATTYDFSWFNSFDYYSRIPGAISIFLGDSEEVLKDFVHLTENWCGLSEKNSQMG